MLYYEIAIAALIAADISTLFVLYHVRKERNDWRAMWTRDAKELLNWKRNGLMRDPETGRYKRKGEF